MDKSRLSLPRNNVEYKEGVLNFIQFAISNGESNNRKLRCPSLKCMNVVYQSFHDLYTDCTCDGFMPTCTFWSAHDELQTTSDRVDLRTKEESQVDIMNIISQDALGFHPDSSIDVELEEVAGHSNEMGDKFYSIMSDVSKELYLGCGKQSKLSTVIHLFHLKNLNS